MASDTDLEAKSDSKFKWPGMCVIVSHMLFSIANFQTSFAMESLNKQFIPPIDLMYDRAMQLSVMIRTEWFRKCATNERSVQ